MGTLLKFRRILVSQTRYPRRLLSGNSEDLNTHKRTFITWILAIPVAVSSFLYLQSRIVARRKEELKKIQRMQRGL